MQVREFMRSLNTDRVEGELLKTIFTSLLVSFAFLGAMYLLRFRTIANFMPRYGFYLFFAALSIALLAAAIRQVRAYQEFPCMSGMMIGMTTGMIAGFLPGLYLGATNGMFVGGFTGVVLGMFIGSWIGRCCGIMGIMEGMMAGFMGGLMGAMTALMMFNDSLKIAVVISFIVTSMILFLLNYLVYCEMKESARQLKEDHFITVVFTFIVIALFTWIMLYGPRSVLFT